MSENRVWLVRHGETEWSKSGQHTGRTDLPLTETGNAQARALGEALAGHTFARVLSSPARRAVETCRLAGYGDVIETTDDLWEWDYGDYEGRTTVDIQKERPGWLLWDDGAVGGETIAAVGRRARKVIDQALAVDGDVALFSHGHMLRVLTACWLRLPAKDGRLFALDTATISVLGFEHGWRVVERWNQDSHSLGGANMKTDEQQKVGASPKVLAIDIGGSHVKILATGKRQRRRFVSGPTMTAQDMADNVKSLAQGWDYDVVSIGYPGPVVHNRPVLEPHNLGPGWCGFDFEAAFERPVKVVNDALLQAIGSYEGGRMLFLGLGTGLGSAMIVGNIAQPMELAHLPYKKHRTYEEYVGAAGLKRLGKKKWRREVIAIVEALTAALEPDYVVLGGGNVKELEKLPPRTRRGANANAFKGGFRLWEEDSVII